MKTFIGIDPGSSSGALAWICEYVDMNHIVQYKYGSIRFDKHTPQDIDVFLKVSADISDTTAYIELVHTMPGQGIASAGKFLKSVGVIEGLLIANGIPFKSIPPQTWMKSYGMKKDKEESKSDWKKRLRAKLSELLPEVQSETNTSDAFLIAKYCMDNENT